MDITPSSLEAITRKFEIRFNRGFQRIDPTWGEYAERVPSQTRENEYPFMHMTPKLREWVGDRTVENLKASTYSLVNKKYEATIEIPRESIEDDQLGLWDNRTEMMGQEARLWPDDLVATALLAGTTDLCYDGQFYFDTDHPVDPFDASKGTQSNLFTGRALTEANYATTRAAMMTYKEANERRLKINGNLLVVPPSLEKTARKIVEAELLSQASGGSDSNVFRGTAKVLVIPELVDDAVTDAWFLIDASKPIKPFIFQERVTPEFQMLTSLDSDHVVKTDRFLWGTRARGNAGYALWQLATRNEP